MIADHFAAGHVAERIAEHKAECTAVCVAERMAERVAEHVAKRKACPLSWLRILEAVSPSCGGIFALQHGRAVARSVSGARASTTHIDSPTSSRSGDGCCFEVGRVGG
jgi:hypothetical protein